MSVLYTPTTNKSVRVTLTLSVQDDFNPRQIDWRKLFELEDNEQVKVILRSCNISLNVIRPE